MTGEKSAKISQEGKRFDFIVNGEGIFFLEKSEKILKKKKQSGEKGRVLISSRVRDGKISTFVVSLYYRDSKTEKKTNE